MGWSSRSPNRERNPLAAVGELGNRAGKQTGQTGKRIVGVYVRGGTEADVPPALEDYADDIVNWNSDSIISAIDGTTHVFSETPDGSAREPVHGRVSVRC